MHTVSHMPYGRIAFGVRAYRNCHTVERQLVYGVQMPFSATARSMTGVTLGRE